MGLDVGEGSSSEAHAAARMTGQRLPARSRQHAQVQAVQRGGRASGSTLWEVRAAVSTSPAPWGYQGSPPEKPQGGPAPCRVQPWSHVAPGLIGSLGTQEQVPHRRERAQGQDHEEIVTEVMGKPNVLVEETHRIQLCKNIVPKNDNVSATESVNTVA